MDPSVRQVAQQHLDAVSSGDPEAMAADYAPDAVLERGADVYSGRAAILAYFRGVPARLGAARVVFDELTVVEDTATFRWHLEGGETPASGTDVCTVVDGAIIHQVVHLASEDF